MNESIEMKKKLLKQALSKNQAKKEDVVNQRIVGKNFQRKTIECKFVQSAKTLELNQKRKIQEYVSSKEPIKIEESISSINQENSIYTYSENFSQKPSQRSSFSESLYTSETDHVKNMISRIFQKKNIVQKLLLSLEEKNLQLKKQELTDLKEKQSRLLLNEIFVLSLETRLRERKGKERQYLVEREVIKKVTRQILLNQNQKECYITEITIQNFLDDQLRKIKRKEF